LAVPIWDDKECRHDTARGAHVPELPTLGVQRRCNIVNSNEQFHGFALRAQNMSGSKDRAIDIKNPVEHNIPGMLAFGVCPRLRMKVRTVSQE
jgi:hypothetical protein